MSPGDTDQIRGSCGSFPSRDSGAMCPPLISMGTYAAQIRLTCMSFRCAGDATQRCRATFPLRQHQVESLIPSGDDFIFASSASGRGTESGGKGSRRRDDENPGVDTREIGCSREASCSTVAHEPIRSCLPREMRRPAARGMRSPAALEFWKGSCRGKERIAG